MTTFSVEWQNEHHFAVDQVGLERAVGAVLLDHGERFQGEAVELSIVITDDAEVRALNHAYRGIDQTTDILSFPAADVPAEIADEAAYLGDLIIAYPYATIQAEREGHPLQDSLCLLVVHGTLHLLGYDHGDHDSRTTMWAAQEKALMQLNISPEIVPALEQASHDETSSP